MSLMAKQTGATFNPAPQGTFVARCVQCVDLGTQYSQYYQTSKHKVLIGWELPTELQDVPDGPPEPFLVWKRYTLSLHQNSALRGDLESWRNRPFSKDELEGFSIVKLVGVPCMINILHEEKEDATYANVNSVMSLPKGTQVAEQVHKSIVFDIDDWNDEVFQSFSEHLQATIKNAAELKEPKEDPRQQDQQREEPDDSDIPFSWLLPFIVGSSALLGMVA